MSTTSSEVKVGEISYRCGSEVHDLGCSRALVVGGGTRGPRVVCDMIDADSGSVSRVQDCPISIGSSGMVGSRLLAVEAFTLEQTTSWTPVIAWSDPPYEAWRVDSLPSAIVGRPLVVVLDEDSCAVVAASPAGLEVFRGAIGGTSRHWDHSTHVEARGVRDIAAGCRESLGGGLWIVASASIFGRNRLYFVLWNHCREVTDLAVLHACGVGLCALDEAVILGGGALGAISTIFQAGDRDAGLGPVVRIDGWIGGHVVRVGKNRACALVGAANDFSAEIIVLDAFRSHSDVRLVPRRVGRTSNVYTFGSFGAGRIILVREPDTRGGPATLTVMDVGSGSV